MFRTSFLFALATLIALPALAAPTKLVQQGRFLDDAGTPLEGSFSLSFALFDDPSTGAALWSEVQDSVFESGYYAVTLGEQVPLDDLLFATEPVWLEVAIDGQALSPRQEIVSVPYALRATAAEHLEGGMVDAQEISIDGTVVIDADEGRDVYRPPFKGERICHGLCRVYTLDRITTQDTL